MDSRRRWYWLAFFGSAALVALVPELYFPDEEQGRVRPLAPGAEHQGELAALRSAGPASAASPVKPAAESPLPQVDLFAAHSWYVVPPAPPVVARPVVAPVAPVRVAPPLPFQFIGKLDDSQRLQVFLLSGERLLVVAVGDVIDDTYRVERIDAQQMTLTYLPMQQTQLLAVGSAL